MANQQTVTGEEMSVSRDPASAWISRTQKQRAQIAARYEREASQVKTDGALLTTTLNSGVVVLAKLYKGEAFAKTFANRTQAYKAAEAVGGEVIQKGRPFFVMVRP